MTSNINFASGQTVANSFATKADASGNICVTPSVDTHVIVDVVAETSALVPHNAARQLDTRQGGGTRVLANGSTSIHVTNVGGQTILGNLTIAAPAGDGFATVFPCSEGLPVPLTSNINFASGQTVANSFATKADASGNICVTPSVDTHVIVDVVAETSALVPHNAIRRLDSRVLDGFVTITDGLVDEGQAIYRVQTNNATYDYQKIGGGFSSILDRAGVDWVGYHPGGQGFGEWRGIPNAGGCCHPGFPTTTEGVAMTTSIVSQVPDRVVIRSTSANGWDVSWDFRPNYVTMTLAAAPDNYWLQYEGTPGGELTYDDWWSTVDGVKHGIYDTFDGDLAVERVYFADGTTPRSIFLARHEDDAFSDHYGYTPGMTIWGFARAANDPTVKPSLPQHMSIGIVDSNTHSDVVSAMAAAVAGQ